MLVLSRKSTEAIVINDAVRVIVLGIKGDRVRLGIEAPRHVTVDRGEVHERRTRFVEVAVGAGVCDGTVDFGAAPLDGSADDTMH
jgi:carbon storage regulator